MLKKVNSTVVTLGIAGILAIAVGFYVNSISWKPAGEEKKLAATGTGTETSSTGEVAKEPAYPTWAASATGRVEPRSGEVRIVKDLQFPISDRHVILVEDIVDTGITMNYLLHYLEGRGPKTLKIAALLSKPSRRKVEIPVEYLGFTIPDAFVYGYGLDRAQFDRNLPFITSQE